MVPINKDIAINLNKLIKFVFPKKDKYLNEKTLFYLRLYTDLLRAETNMAEGGCNRVVYLLRIVRNMSRSTEFKEEEAYLKRIREIANEIISHISSIKRIMNKDPTGDAFHAKTKLQLAQNICILRILKRGSK